MKGGRSSRTGTEDASILSRYCRVADDLPDWAKGILESQMGTIFVGARDSFEIYLMSLEDVMPKDDYVVFCKRFAEIFEAKAQIILRRIEENRRRGSDHMVTNDFFWREFGDLFVQRAPNRGYVGKKIHRAKREAERKRKVACRRVSRWIRRRTLAGYIHLTIQHFGGVRGKRYVDAIDPNLIYTT